MDIFFRLLGEIKEELRLLGVEPKNLGSQLSRKRVKTIVCAGCKVSPPIISIWLRS